MTPVDPGDTIGFVGLGRMGAPMSSHLVGAGYKLSAFDVRPSAREAAAGAPEFRVVASAAGAAEGARAVILMLPNSEVVTRVVLTDGLLGAMDPGSFLIDMSSSDAMQTRKLASAANERDVRFVDAPVSGGVAGARAGTLTIMAGGEQFDVDDCRPILEALGRQVTHVGPVGAGHALKALNNLLSATSLLASAEALVVADRFGLDPNVVLDVVNQSSGRSWSTEEKLPRFVIPGTFDSGFALALMVKDMRMAVSLARAVGSTAILGEAAVALWEQASRSLPAEADHTEIARWVADRARAGEGGA